MCYAMLLTASHRPLEAPAALLVRMFNVWCCVRQCIQSTKACRW